MNDLRFACRQFVRNPVWTAVAVLTLALGIGPNTAIFSVVNAVLLSALPYREAHRLVVLLEHDRQSGGKPVAYPNFLDWRRMNRSFQDLACYRPSSSMVINQAGTDRVESKRISAGFFRTLGVLLPLGREFSPEEDAAGGPPAVVLSQGAWQRYFGGDANAMGRTLNIEGTSHTVVGVTPADFRFAGDCDLYLPIAPAAHPEPRVDHDNLYVLGRLKMGTTFQQAEAEMRLVAQQLQKEYPKENADETVEFVRLSKWLVGNLDQVSLMLLGAVSIILLLACVNVAGLVLARLGERRREFAIRAAVGADASQLVCQTLVESLALALLGGGLGLLLARPLVSTLTVFVAPEQLAAARLDWRVAGFTLLVSCLAAIAFGLFPALAAARVNLNEPLRDRVPGAAPGQHRVQELLVASQIAFALVLLTGSGLMLRTMSALLAANPGFRPAGVVTMEIQVPESRFIRASQTPNGFDAEKFAQVVGSYEKEVLERVQRLPGVESAALTSHLLFSGGMSWFGIRLEEAAQNAEQMIVHRYSVSPDYFRVMGIPVLKGRVFTMGDNRNQPRVALLNATTARQLSPDRDPIGRRFVIPDFSDYGPCTVVGVVADTLHERLGAPAPTQVYLPFLQWPMGLTLVIRTALAPAVMGETVRRELVRFDKEAAVHGVRGMQEHLAHAIAQPRQMNRVLALMAGLALILASAGIYAVMTQTVIRKRHEIGVRLALGATSSSILRLVLRKAMLLAACGGAAGVVAALYCTRVLQQWLVGVGPGDPLTLLIVALVLGLVALGAAYWPARKAASTDPMVVLRSE